MTYKKRLSFLLMLTSTFFIMTNCASQESPEIDKEIEDSQNPAQEDSIPTNDEETPEQRNKTTEFPTYNSIDEYTSLILNPEKNQQYKSIKPINMERLSFGEDAMNFAPDGISADIFILTQKNWDIGQLEDIQNFYFEIIGPSPCWTKPDCNEPNTIDYYGPFKGKLKLLVQ
jgi:hypothetical protein